MNTSIRYWEDPERPPEPANPGHAVSLALGVFDGVHRGHQRLLHRVVYDAEALYRGRPAVLTFEPNPAAVFQGPDYPGNLTTLEYRLELFKRFGIEEVMIIRFSRRFAALSGPGFLDLLIRAFPELRLMVVGYNFRLGHNQDMNGSLLAQWMSAHGIRVDIVPALKDNEQSISSSRIRRAIAAGDLEEAEALLGHPYRISVAADPPQLLPPPGRYRCTIVGEASSREGMMEISDEGTLQWEPRITPTYYVIPRSIADGYNS